MKHSNRWHNWRIKLIGLGFILAFGLIGYRALSLQVLDHELFEKRAQRQYQRIVQLPRQRGTIYDRNGQELALSTAVDSVYVEPHRIQDIPGTAKALARVLSLSQRRLLANLSKERRFLWVKRQVSPRESESLRALKLKGVGFIKEHRRYYPNSQLGAQVIGFTGLDPKGLEGLELQYDSQMLGERGFLVVEKDGKGKSLGFGDHDASVQGGNPGHSLRLTLDKNLQYIAEKELAAGVRKAQATAGTVVVLDPETGKVLAMASYPDYNPNSYRSSRPSQWRNRAVCDAFEPGSTMKPFLVAAALNEGLVSPQQKIDCENGLYRVGGRKVRDTHRYGRLTVNDIIKLSSNIGSAKIGKKLERDRFYRYLRDFGFGDRSGIDFPGESKGLLRRPEKWFEADLANISFGQGIAVTALQLARATAAIANGGLLMEANLVEQVMDSQGAIVEKYKPRTVHRVMSEAVAQQVRDMMVSVVSEDGTGPLAQVPGFTVAGKTGTAQKVDPVTGGYSADKRVASFVGFLPAEAPKLVILVVVDEPQGQTYGGLVAAPVFSRIAEQSLRHLGVSPTEPVKQSALPEIVFQDPFPAALTSLADVRAKGDLPIMPDCVGMSSRQVLQTMERAGLNIKLKGSGRVVEQNPAPHRAIQYGSEVWVRLAPPA
ncbi:penicillin-binding protein [Syntrophotalea acetylenivorans]|uniref:Penicillin-binding protein n=1 Tax=Syntrophotalea acetylenivorans TaxID=1842532 RepID=A0A1L3GSH3_9BACT|nr:penicillin-binding protein [Syntrophotalea acetylenivorans]APG28872.1 penicillin-binding protein [Syntrophotalea acetylenivorans]